MVWQPVERTSTITLPSVSFHFSLVYSGRAKKPVRLRRAISTAGDSRRKEVFGKLCGLRHVEINVHHSARGLAQQYPQVLWSSAEVPPYIILSDAEVLPITLNALLFAMHHGNYRQSSRYVA